MSEWFNCIEHDYESYLYQQICMDVASMQATTIILSPKAKSPEKKFSTF